MPDKIKILVVDDRPENIMAMERVLDEPDIEIITAGSGNEALSKMLEHDFGLVLLDVQMPDMDGFEVAELMRSNKRTSGIPIIFVTAISKEERHVFKGYESGAVDYLFKPVDPIILKSKVNVFVELQRQKETLKRQSEELCQAREQAETANIAKRDFLAAMSHEIRTPMNGVLGMLELLEKTGLTEEQREYMDVARFSAGSLLTLINDILDLSRIEAGKLQLVQEVFNPRELVRQMEASFRSLLEEKSLEMRTSVGEDVPEFIKADQGRVRQILYNLIGNSLKFTEEGHISAEIEAEKADCGQNGLRLAIRVEDTGIGIAKEKQREVFEPFTQVDGSYTKKYQGTGLGLGIVRKLAEMMNGEVELSSEAGVGTTITVRLEVGRADGFKSEEDRKSPEGTLQTGRLKILLAEDNPVNRLYVLKIVENMGHDVHVAEDGRQALEALAENDYDLVLMDVQMPEMDGIEATRAIRSGHEGVDRNIPIIALTAHAMSGDREKFISAGMDDYLAKPLNSDDLSEKLSNLERRSADRDRAAEPEKTASN
jgi:signal transduction histidine kinase